MRVINLKGSHDGVATVAFTRDGTQLLVQTGPTYSGWCDAESLYHRVDVVSSDVRTFELPTRGLDYTFGSAVLSSDGRFVAGSGFSDGGCVLRLLPIEQVGAKRDDAGAERGFRANGERIVWVAFTPGEIINIAVNQKKEECILMRLDISRALAAPPSRPDYYDQYHIHKDGLVPTARLDRRLGRDNFPAFSPDGRLVALWPETASPLVFDVQDGLILLEVPWPGRKVKERKYHNAAISPDAQRVAFTGGGLLLCARVDGTGKPWRAKKPIGYVTSAVFHPDGHTLLAVDRNGCAHRLDAATGRVIASHAWGSDILMCAACSPDGTLAAAGQRGGKVVLWDLD